MTEPDSIRKVSISTSKKLGSKKNGGQPRQLDDETLARIQKLAKSTLDDATKQLLRSPYLNTDELRKRLIAQFPKIDAASILSSSPRPIYDGEITLPKDPGHETNRLLREMSAKLDGLEEKQSNLLAPNYETNSSTIIFGNKLIKLKKDTNQSALCAALFTEPHKKWSWDEMLEYWGEHSYGKDDWRKVYEAARSINEKVAIKTGVQDLLDYDKSTVMLNTDYM